MRKVQRPSQMPLSHGTKMLKPLGKEQQTLSPPRVQVKTNLALRVRKKKKAKNLLLYAEISRGIITEEGAGPLRNSHP